MEEKEHSLADRAQAPVTEVDCSHSSPPAGPPTLMPSLFLRSSDGRARPWVQRVCLGLLPPLWLAACAAPRSAPPPRTVTPAVTEAAADPLLRARAAISSEQLLKGIERLASDDFEGRAPGTRGENQTVDWLKARFKAAGLEPAGDGGSWTQSVPMVAYTSTPQLSVTVHGKSHALAHLSDYVAWSPAPRPRWPWTTRTWCSWAMG